jgi:hypothetical protein
VSFDSEVRIGTCRKIKRTSESGHHLSGRTSPIYSARLQCSGAGAQAQKKTIANLIVRQDGDAQISAGPTFDDLVAYRRCPADGHGAKQ